MLFTVLFSLLSYSSQNTSRDLGVLNQSTTKTMHYRCGGLSENSPTDSFLNSWSPVRGTIWEGLGGMVLSE